MRRLHSDDDDDICSWLQQKEGSSGDLWPLLMEPGGFAVGKFGKFLHILTKLPIKGSLITSLFPVWKLSRFSGNGYFGQSGMFLKSLKSFRIANIYSHKISRQDAKFANSSHTLPRMLQKQFTHFWSIYVARTIYVLCPESFLHVRVCQKFGDNNWIFIFSAQKNSLHIFSHS